MSFPGNIYAPPGPYTYTNSDSPVQGLAASVRIPLMIGVGSEILTQTSLEIVRGSSSSVDQRIPQEDEAGRAVLSVSVAGQVTLTAFNGTLDRIQVKNFPIVTGDGSGTTATNSSGINVTVNGVPVVVLAVDGTRGILQLSVRPVVTDDVRVTYFFKRTDTLITDDLSDQVSPTAPVIYGQVGENYDITSVNNTLLITVDSEDLVTVTISDSPGVGWAAAQITAFINSAASGTSLVASTAVDNLGNTVVSLTADRGISIGDGSANSTLGLTSGDSTARNAVFYTFQGPIVDGSNGGVTTTDPANVTVKVDGVQVIPTAVDGQSRAVTLPFAPEVGATVTCQYFFNAWQDTYDILQHRNVTDIFQAGFTPDRNDFVEGADFVLQNDLIVWGTAAIVSAGEHTSGSTLFNGTQAGVTLVDVRQYLSACESVVNTAVNPPVETRKVFQLPLQPTTGNGRNSPLGTTTFEAVANGRIDLPTNRPDLVYVYWGYSLSDAVERGRVEVTAVDSSTNQIFLASAVPVGATVYATFYYNTLVDKEYNLVVSTPGASGVGSYKVVDEDSVDLFTPTLGTKSAGLATITLQFPSGSERLPDVRFETPFVTTDFEGPVEEDVTVEFASQAATLGKFAFPGSGPYYTVVGSSDHFDLEVDGSALAGGFVNISNPLGVGAGFSAQLSGEEIVYESDSGGATYVIDATNNAIDLEVDGILVQALANLGATQTAAHYVSAINRAAMGEFAAAAAGGVATITLAATASDVDDYYVGWTVKVTTGPAAGDTRTVTGYVGSTKVATVGVAFTAPPVITNTYQIYNPDTLPVMRSATQFLAPVVITASEYDSLAFQYTGSVTGTVAINMTGANVIPPGTYASASALATAMQVPLDAAILAAGVDIEIEVGADTSGRLTFSLAVDPTDTTGGYLEVITGGIVAARRFALLAGFDHAAAGAGQAKLINSNIARRFTVGSAPLIYDRIILRNRLLPGRTGSMDGAFTLGLTELKVLGGTGAVQAGLTPNELGLAGLTGTITAPTLASEIGLSNGQIPPGTYTTAADGQPVVTLYASGGTTPQNNVFKFTFEGVPVTVVFTDAAGAAIASGGSADVPLGPVSGVAQNTILSQIAAAMTAAGISAAPVQEGAGIRFRGTSLAAQASIVIGNGNANDTLGFTTGDSASRTPVEPEVLVSALMAHANATLGASMYSWHTGGTATYFAGEALAKTVRDEANAEYLFVESLATSGLGTTSSVAITEAAIQSVTRPGTGLGVVGGEGNSGEDAVDGFFVISSDPVDGSGSVNNSALNSGVGQDGNVGQTYRDLKTGLTFSLLPASGGASYPAGETFTFKVRKVVTTDSNLPVNTIPGVQLTVSNTQGIAVNDTAVVATYEQGGAQPAVGDVYYISYNYTKQDFSAQLFSKLSSIEAAYGSNGTSNPVVLASYLAIINGAVIIAIKQVQKDTDGDGDGVAESASEAAYQAAIDDVEGPLPGGVDPDILVPLYGSSLTLFQYLARHCDIQSSIRYRAERTAIVGVSAGTQERDVGNEAQAIGRTRLRMVYPDIYTLSLSKADGTTDTFLVDGTYMAAAVAGNRCAPTIDVATPWTSARIFGFDEIARVLDQVQMNQVAVRGVTVIEQKGSSIKIRQGLTTDMTSVLTKLPTIVTIADEVQRQSRSAMDRFIGTKFLPGVTGQIEAQLSNTLKLLKGAQIIAAYTGVSAKVADDDPTTAEVGAAYQPVFPLLYIVIQFNLRSSL